MPRARDFLCSPLARAQIAIIIGEKTYFALSRSKKRQTREQKLSERKFHFSCARALASFLIGSDGADGGGSDDYGGDNVICAGARARCIDRRRRARALVAAVAGENAHRRCQFEDAELSKNATTSVVTRAATAATTAATALVERRAPRAADRCVNGGGRRRCFG